MGRSLQRLFVLCAVLVLLWDAAPTHPAAPLDSGQASTITTLVPPNPPRPNSFDPLTFDDFNRVVADGWGTSTAGVAWADNSLRENGQTSAQAGNAISVDGLSGRIDYGGHEPIFMLASSGPWQEPEWQMTGSFKVSAVPTGPNAFNDVYFWIFKDAPDPYADAAMLHFTIGDDAIAPAQAGMVVQGTIGGPNRVFALKTDWQANTTYCVKWAHVWGTSSSAKVWACADPEPQSWMVSRDASQDLFTTGANTVLQAMAFPKNSGTTTWFDDLRFSDPGHLPVQPVPDEVQLQENGGSGGDPVQTFSGALTYNHTDLAIAGRGPVPMFARSYNSLDTRSGRLGPGWNDSYSSRLRDPGDGSEDVLVVRSTGNTDRFHHNPDGSFSPPAAVFSALVRNGDGSYLLSEKDQSGQTFNADGALTSVFDRYGNTSTLSYNGSGQLVGVSDPAGRGSLTLGYMNGLLTTVTDWASPARTVTYQYDASGRLWKVTDRENGTTTFTYDSTSSRIASITDARNHVALTLTYDTSGRVATQKDARGLTTGDATAFAYVVNGDGTRVTTHTYPVTSFEPTFHPTIVDTHNANGWIVQRVSHPSSTETLTASYSYDTLGDRVSEIDPRGNETDYCFDTSYAGDALGSRGNLTRIIAPSANVGANRPVTLLAYDAKDNVTETVAPRGVSSAPNVTCSTNLSAISTAYATDLSYDAAAAKLLSTTSRFTDPDTGAKTATTKYEYGDAANPGLVTRVIPARGNTTGNPDYTYATTMAYFTSGAKAGLLSGTTDALGNIKTYDYDAVGRLTSAVDPNGNAAGGVPADHTTNYVYDKEDRVRFVKLPAPVAGGSQLVSETRYDEVGNPIVRIDANGQVTTSAFDERDGLFQVKESPNAWTDPAAPPAGAITTEYAYDAAGNLTRMTRAKGDAANERVTDYAYDGRALARRETQYPSWPATTPTLVTTSTFDPDGNPANYLDPLGKTTTHGYDALNRLSSVTYSDGVTPAVSYGYDPNGNRTSMTDGTGSTSYVYDEANRLTSTTTPGPKTVGYRYDLDGNRTKLIYPDATAVNSTFNKASQLASLLDWASRTTSCTYWPDGLPKTATNADSSVATYSYDNARRATDILHRSGASTIAHQTYGFDPVGNVTGLQEFVQGITSGSSWSPSVTVNDVTPPSQLTPAVTLGADGTAYAVWRDSRVGPGTEIYFSKRDPVSGAWSANEHVNNVSTNDQQEPAIAVDAANNVYAVWTDNRAGGTDYDIYFSKRSAATGTWSASVRVNDDSAGARQDFPSLAISSAGEAIAIWRDQRGGGQKYNIYASRLPAGSTVWSANFKVTDNATAFKEMPDIAIGSTGIAYAVWSDRRSGNDDIWFSSLLTGGSVWAANVKISDDPGTAAQITPDVGVDTAGNVTAVWRDARTAPGAIRASRRAAGGSIWTASAAVAGGDLNDPSLAVRADGDAYLAWTVGPVTTYTTVSGSRYSAVSATWTTAEPVSDLGAGTSSGRASVALDSTRTVVLWDGGVGLPGVAPDIKARINTGGGGAGTDTFTYGYDKLSRLTTVGGPDGSRTYTYDPVSNRASKVLGGTTAYSYDRADRITTAGATSITVNANGNTTAKGGDTFTYDQANRLKTASVAGATETYVYDGDGTRFSRQVGGGTPTRYVSDLNRGLPVTIDDGTHKYVYGFGLAYAVSGTTIEIYHTDRIGSVRAITNATGVVTAAYRTDEWGVPTTSTGSSSQLFRFTGEPGDGTGLTYLRARYYDPSLGRFASRDRFSGLANVPQSLDRYTYALGNPLRFVDPTGMKSSILQGPDLGTILVGGGVLLVGGAICVFIGACEAAIGGAAIGGAAELGTGVILDIITPEVEGGPAAAEAAITYSEKILSQIAVRGWTTELIQETVSTPTETHSVWDFTTGVAEAATAYVRADGAYVVVNDESGVVIQVSDATDPGWLDVWNDPRFQR